MNKFSLYTSSEKLTKINWEDVITVSDVNVTTDNFIN